ncbi:MAG: 2-C-methyl-D-erythritol 4-phosphate cytidylyltransferase [Fibrobacteraceae bacterium]
MQNLKPQRQSNPHFGKFAAVLPAGGLGKRMGSTLIKQLLDLGGKPVYQYSLETFAKMSQIGEVVLVVPRDWKSHFEEDLKDFRYADKIKIVIGGKERWESVRNGIESLSSDAEYVLVHDVARPFLSEKLVLQAMETLEKSGACLVARPSADTIKLVETDKVVRTIPREQIYLAQTPQCAKVSVLKELYKKIDNSPLSFVPTDEASILEFFGIPVYIVPGNTLNDKLTTPADFERFSAICQRRT